MTAVLNRKFDVLAHSALSLPPQLMDVLSLLVAHANDTELFKTEFRVRPEGAGEVVCGPSSSYLPPDVAAAEHQAASRRFALVREQYTKGEDELDAALKVSQETILVAAEHSMQRYADNLKKMNDIAMSTSARQLRDMRLETQADMEAFRDGVCATTIDRTREELDGLRAGWYEDLCGQVETMKADLHRLAVEAQTEMRNDMTAYAAFVANASNAIHAVPLVEAHACAAEREALSARLDVLSASAATQLEVSDLAERLKRTEQAVAHRSVGKGSTREGDNRATGSVAASTTNTNTASAAASASVIEKVSNHANRSSSGGTRSPSSPPAAAASQTFTELLGIEVSTGADGAVVTTTQPDSAAAALGLLEGTIISFVGRSPVLSGAELNEAAESSFISGGADDGLKLTVFDPRSARVRFVTVAEAALGVEKGAECA